MEDIAPELLRKIQEQFEQDIEKNSMIKKFKELTKKGKVTIPNHGGDIPRGTLNSILKQAGLR